MKLLDAVNRITGSSRTSGDGDLCRAVMVEWNCRRLHESHLPAPPMIQSRPLCVAIFLAFASASASALSAQDTAASAKADATYINEIRPLMKQFCWDCHTGDDAEAGLQLDEFTDVAAMKKNRDHWKKILKMVDARAMPPADADRLADQQRIKLVDWIDKTLFYVDCNQPADPGRVTIRRLNRVEYNNTIRDLLGVTHRPADDFPSDDVGSGFDNIGDVLSLPPLLFEKYMDAAEQLAAEVIVLADPTARMTLGGNQLRIEGSAQSRGGAVVMTSRAKAFGKFDVPLTGRYTLLIRAAGDLAGDSLPRMEVAAGKTEKAFEVDKRRGSTGTYQMELNAQRGTLEVAAAFTNDYYNPSGPKGDQDRNLYIYEITLQGPRKIDPESIRGLQREVMKRRPANPKDPVQVAESAAPILRKLANLAFRRQVKPDELKQLVRLVQLVVNEREESFERGMQVAISAILVSPHFLFRIEADGDPNDASNRHLISNLELASRLSYFLWSSMPDHELFTLARKGALRKPDVLRAQVKRMLADPKAEALVQNFAGQWLNLRNLDEVTPSQQLFPDFDQALREDMKNETYALFRAVMKEDLAITDFLNADYTFVNERLAKLYGIQGVRGSEFKKVRLPTSRMGIATQASILTLTSNPNRTSPVKRGKWILENLLGAPPPEPPGNVPDLDETRKKNPAATLREQLEQHRRDPTCAICHNEMDPIGLALENFDAIGRWRDAYEDGAIDPRGSLPSGDSFSTSEGMLRILAKRKQEFSRCLTEKMLTYALGRGLEYYDQCAVDRILKDLTGSEYRFLALAQGVVMSDPFLMRRGENPDGP